MDFFSPLPHFGFVSLLLFTPHLLLLRYWTILYPCYRLFFSLGFWDLSYVLGFYKHGRLVFLTLPNNIWPGCCSQNPTFQQSLVSKDASLQCCTSTAGNIKTSFAFFSCCCCNPAKQLDYKDFGWWKLSHPESTSRQGRQQKATAVSRLEEDKEENKRWLLPKRLAQMLQWWGLYQK